MSFAVGKTGLAYARLWHLVDAQGQVLGHLASGIATTLQGMHKPIYDPSNDCGDYVVVINAKKIVVSGDKLEKKIYYSHSGYPGGISATPLKKMLEDKPEAVIEKAVYGMLPKNQLRKKRMNRLLVFPDEKHPYMKNIATFHQHPELQQFSRQQWDKMTAEQLEKYLLQINRQKLYSILQQQQK